MPLDVIGVPTIDAYRVLQQGALEYFTWLFTVMNNGHGGFMEDFRWVAGGWVAGWVAGWAAGWAARVHQHID